MDMSQHPAQAVDTVETFTKEDAAEARATKMTYVAIVALIAAWGTSTAVFGVAGFFLPAVAAVPLIFVTMVFLTLG